MSIKVTCGVLLKRRFPGLCSESLNKWISRRPRDVHVKQHPWQFCDEWDSRCRGDLTWRGLQDGYRWVRRRESPSLGSKVLQPSFTRTLCFDPFLYWVFVKISFKRELHDLNTKIQKKKFKRLQCTSTCENASGKLKALSRDEQF